MDYSYPVAITSDSSNNIRIIGNNVLGGSKKHPFYWSTSTGLRDIGVLGVGSYGIPSAVNNLGEVVGNSATTSTGANNHPVYWNPSRGAAPLDLGTSANPLGHANSINDSGVIVGYVSSLSGTPIAAYWTRKSGDPATGIGITYNTATPLPVPPEWPTGQGASGVYISPAGDIVGILPISGGDNRAVIWKNLGSSSSPSYTTPLFIPDSSDITATEPRFAKIATDGRLLVAGYGETATGSGNWVWAEGNTSVTRMVDGAQIWGLNDLGQASGHVSVPLPSGSYTFHGFAWDGAPHDLGTLGGSSSRAYGSHFNGMGYTINHSGQVIGHSFTAADADLHAFLWSSTAGMRDLNAASLTPSKGAFSVFNDAAGITDNGYITGMGALPKVKGKAYSNTYLLIPK
jgi:probable HAF family extracellular repeat protein